MVDERRTASVRRKYNRNALWFDRMDRMILDEWRRRVTEQVYGQVLEVGVGTGKNLGFYNPEVTRQLVGIDLSPDMLSRAREKVCIVPVSLVEMDAQRMSFPDASFDTVVATCVFCSVPDPVLGLKEVRRVCKPDGHIVLLEHVRIDRPVIGALMDLLDPVTTAIIGSHINRRTVENARLAGLTVERVEPIKGDLIKLIHCRP